MNGPADKAWHKLDNAAKIFPSTSRKSDTKVFRFCCELRETVDGLLLQTALERTLNDFPSFQYIMKRGLFWYYLEQSSLVPIAHIEDTPPCSTIYYDRKSLLFDVTWYEKRINLEVYHALTDGTGAMQFLKTLVLFYLKLVHPDEMNNVIGIDYDASDSQKMADSFSKYYNPGKNRNRKNPVAYQLKGSKEAEWRLKVIEGTVSACELLKKAHEYKATATVLVIALLMKSIYGDMSIRDRRKPVVIAVPVNLRNYFESKSALNFFSIVDVQYNFSEGGDSLEEIIEGVKKCLNERLNEEYLQNRLNKLFGIEKNPFVRIVPLVVKNLFMRAAYSIYMRENTASVSNLGIVDMPADAKQYIRLFDVFTSTEKLQICMCSFNDRLNISFTSAFQSTDAQCSFFRMLSRMGVEVEIAANSLAK